MTQLARFRGVFLFVGALALYAATFDHSLAAPDETTRFGFARSVASRGLAAVPNSGRQSMHPPLTAASAAPLIALASRWDAAGTDEWARRAAVTVNTVAAALVVLVFWRLLLALGYAARISAIATAIFALANPLWPYSKRFYGEPLSALFVLLAALGVVRSAKSPRQGVALACVAVGLLGLNNHSAAAAAGLGVVVALAAARRWSATLAAAGGLVAGAAVAAVVQVIRFGRLATGYEGQGFSFRLLDSIPGLFLGPGRSIFLYAPTVLAGVAGVFLAWRRGHRTAATYLLVTSAVLVGVVATWWAWYGGMCFGPRLLLPVLPLASVFMIELLERRRWRAVPVALGAVGLYVQLMGVSVVHEYDMYLWLAPDGSNERLGWFSLKHAPLLRLPRDLALSPWDLSSEFLVRNDQERTVVKGDGKPLRLLEVTQGGQSILWGWSIADVLVSVAGTTSRAHELGARLEPAGSLSGTGGGEAAVDADPQTRWYSGRHRRPDMGVRIDLGAAKNVDRIELVHAPYTNDFPSQATARGSEDGATWRPLGVVPGSPRLSMHPAFYLLAIVALGALAAAVFPRQAACSAA